MAFTPLGNPVLRPADQSIDALQQEIAQEKASTLGRLTREFESALAAFLAVDAKAAVPPPERRKELLDAAADALFWFVVQREACGLRNTEAVLRDYQVPAALRLRMGVVRKS